MDSTGDACSHRDYYGTYHHHKEQRAFAAAALYLGAAAALATQDKPLWAVINSQWRWVAYVALAVSTVLGAFFVYWQFRMRRGAAAVVTLCSEILADAIAPKGQAVEPKLQKLSTLLKPTDSWLDKPVVSEVLAYGTMAVWAGVVLGRILCGA